MDAPVIALTETRMGWAGVSLNDRGITRATLFHHSREAAEGELRAFGAVRGDHPRAADAVERLQQYAAGEGNLLADFPVDLPPATELQQRTWLALRDIPYGETRSYGWLAKSMGVPGRARAIGAMMGQNPIPLWLPCHRVVAADGTLHGFGGGLNMKRELLELEGAMRPLMAV